MQAGEIKMRFGRCPYCRTMVYQNPKAVIYYCSNCRTPIRGKDPEPMDEAEYALSRLEILSADTASVLSGELDAASSKQEEASWPEKRTHELRPSSRRSRRPSSSSDSSIQRCDLSGVSDSSEGYYTAGSECEQRWRRRSPPVSSREPLAVAASPLNLMALADPEIHSEMLHALDNLRRLIVAIELQPRATGGGGGGARAVTRRDSRFFRRLESQLAQALPAGAEEGSPSSSAAASSSRGRGERPAAARQHLCPPIRGGAPFVVCGGCSELLRTPAKVQPSRKRVAKLRCGECDDVLELMLPAAGVAQRHARHRSRTGSARRSPGSRSWHGTDEHERAEGRSGGEPPKSLAR